MVNRPSGAGQLVTRSPMLAQMIEGGHAGLVAILAKILVEKCGGEFVIEPEPSDVRYYVGADFVEDCDPEAENPPVRIYAREIHEDRDELIPPLPADPPEH